MNILIVDDDKQFINLLKNDFLNYFSYQFNDIHIESKYDDYFHIESQKIDIAFIDIDLNTYNGINYAKLFRKKYNQNIIIIFISNREDLVFETLTTGVFQFIRKQKYDHDKLIVFEQLLEHCKEHFNNIILNINGRTTIININDIVYLLSIGHDMIIHTIKNEYTTKMSIKQSLELMDSKLMIQIQRTMIINLTFVANIHHNKVLLFDNSEHHIGRKYQKNVIEKYEEFLLK